WRKVPEDKKQNLWKIITVDTICDIDIRNNRLNKNLRSVTASHHHNFEIQRRGITRKNQGQDGDAKATLFNL
nr:hypothetical protein [Tanacetum cinerariifolium]